MTPRSNVAPVLSKVVKRSTSILTITLSLIAAFATIWTSARQEGMFGPLATASSPVAFLRLTPAADTAFALGDTLHFAAIASDTNGAVLPAPSLTWTVTNTEVAEARSDGSVIAAGPGTTSIVVSAGRTSARAEVVIHPRTAVLRPAADTVDLPEGSATSLIAMPYDMRGKLIRGAIAHWRSLDTTVFTVDPQGLATGIEAGSAGATAELDGASTRLVVRVTPVLRSLGLATGGDQHALASTPLHDAVAIRTLSRQGKPLGGVLVRAAVDGGRLDSDTVRSGDDGLARFRWTLGDRAGVQHFVAESDGLDTTITTTAEADPVAANVEFVLVDSLGSAPAGGALPPVVVRLTDSLGQVLPGVPVRWLAQDGSRIVGTAARTDSLGLATATWTLGPKVGRNRARLIAGPRSEPVLALEVRSAAGAPATITVTEGTRFRGRVAQTLTGRMRVVDTEGNPVDGAAPHAEGGDGSVTFTDPATRADGTARFQWTLGPTAGDQGIQISVGAAKVALTAVASPAPASKVELVAPTISIVTSTSVQAVAVVTDSLGNPIPGIVVQPRVAMGSVSPLRATTDARGRVTFRWTLARRQGDQTLTVHAAGVRVDATKTVRRSASR